MEAVLLSRTSNRFSHRDIRGLNSIGRQASVPLKETTMGKRTDPGYYQCKAPNPYVDRQGRKLTDFASITQTDVAPEVEDAGLMKMVYHTDCNGAAVLTSDPGSAMAARLDSPVSSQGQTQVSQSQAAGTAQAGLAAPDTSSSNEKCAELGALNNQEIELQAVPYKFDVCRDEVPNLELLKQVILTHTGNKPYVCHICYLSFSHTSQLEEHSKKTHSRVKEKLFACDICGLRVTRLKGLKVHTRLHTGERPYKCDVCNKGFIQSSDLSKHLRVHTGEKPYTCDFCGKRFTHSSDLNKHIRIHTGEKPFRCAVCNKGFTQSCDLNKHFRIHTGEKPYKCDICAAGFSWLKDFSKHAKTHMGEKTYKCDVCGVGFTWVKCLRRHQRIHTGEKPFQCQFCQDAFDESCDLKNHLTLHLGEKPFKCDVCDCSFGHVDQLSRHKRTHSGEKPYKCDVCGGDFAWAESLRRHQQIHTRRKRYKCDLCFSSFNQIGELKKHAKRMHSNTSAMFSVGLNQVEHMDRQTAAHTRKSHKCDDCGVGFSQLDHLRNHLHIHIGD